jgi:hypothetical protein
MAEYRVVTLKLYSQARFESEPGRFEFVRDIAACRPESYFFRNLRFSSL